MLGQISQISLEQFTALLSNAWKRRISSVHIHHTWKPRAGQWKGKTTVEAMRRVHMQDNGWSDIAQHLTIGPDGTLWTGRHLDRVPASARGFNGTAAEGPLMIEMVGDFDAGQDQFGGAQAQAAFQATAAICQAFGLQVSALRFHREFNPEKSCPGTGIDLAAFRQSVALLMTAPAGPRPPAPRQLVAPLSGAIPADADSNAEPQYRGDGSRTGDFGETPRGWWFSDADQRVFAAHVVNTEMGRLSSQGSATSSPQSLDTLIASLEQWAQQQDHPRVVFFAHGGLVSETSALREVVLRQYGWWLANGVYPIFFVWETGLLEIFSQAQPDTRGLKDDFLEKVLGPTVGRPAWSRMKASAFLASQPDAGDGQPGGARLLAERLIVWLQGFAPRAAPVRLHAVGHSAGAIFLSHFLPVLSTLARTKKLRPKGKPVIETLALLAPACRADLFKAQLLPLIMNSDIGEFAEFTMNEQAERDDSLKHIYGKSLLYAVRNACEADRPQILGLEESIRPDPDLRTLFGLNPGQKGHAELVLAPTSGMADKRSTSLATAHGDFDNDPATMNSALRRVLALSDPIDLPEPMLPPAEQSRPASPEDSFRSIVRGTAGGAHALCIGIDAYADSPLSGCVADAQLWASTLRAAGVKVHQVLTDAQATKSGIVHAWQNICAQARAGDTVIIQFAGHGTQVPDRSGDEVDDDLDEAWVTHDYLNGAVLLDDEIGALIDRFTPPGVQIVIFTDMCHSGSGTRARELPVQGRQRIRLLPLHNHPRFLKAFSAADPQWARELGARAPGEPEPEIHFAACQDDQFAVEQDGHGAFTLAAVAALCGSPAPRTYREFATAVAARFAGNARQRPGFKALPNRAGLELFGGPHRATGADPTGPGPSQELLQRLDRLEALMRELSRKFDSLG
ncbi:MAG: caspase family protein [Burkholderiaceae bacterium]|nr:caspase family protein [Burkholderiaceae bacterium]